MTLYNDIKKLANELKKKEEEIDNCHHSWVTGDPFYTVYNYDHEWGGPGNSVYIEKKERVCEFCGLFQASMRFRPGWGWSDWENSL